MRRSTITAIAIIAVVVAVVALYFGTRKTASDTTSSPTPSPSASAASPATSASPAASLQATAAGDATITYTNGFSPASVTVGAGHKLTVKNMSNEEIQVDSDPHPVHTDDTDLNIGAIAPGATGSATLTKTGTFGIHNHLDPTEKATVTIK